MNVLLQTHGSKRLFPIPEGLKELSSDIIREVLRHQPECIHAFIAEYLETMVMVREKARDSTVVVSDIFRQGYFLDDLYRRKNVTREQADAYASIMQARWRGYYVRKRFRMYLQKRRKRQDEKEKKNIMKIEEYLKSIGITYEEATRAACIIQAAYRQSRRRKMMITEGGDELRTEGESVPLGQRIRESDRSQGRWDRWDKKEWIDFFEIDEEGDVHHDWPRVGQLFKIPRHMLTPDMEIVRFYGMRDYDGKEQYSYLKGPQKGRNPRGFPIGFLIPVLREMVQKDSPEVIFSRSSDNDRMGNYTYIYEKSVEKQDLEHYADIIRESKTESEGMENREFSQDNEWVLPKILIQIRKDCVRDTDDEVVFTTKAHAPPVDDYYTFRAENAELSLKVIERILKMNCSDLEEAMSDASNMPIYRQAMAGRFLAVEESKIPKYIQKVVIQKETKKGEYENREMDKFEYVFLPKRIKWPKKLGIKVENPIKIPLTRFQGYHSNYRASAGLNKNIMFIMGPMLYSPDNKPFTYHSIFWDIFGPESWYQLLCNITTRKIAKLNKGPNADEEEAEEEQEEEDMTDDENEDEVDEEASEQIEGAEDTVGETETAMTAMAKDKELIGEQWRELEPDAGQLTTDIQIHQHEERRGEDADGPASTQSGKKSLRS